MGTSRDIVLAHISAKFTPLAPEQSYNCSPDMRLWEDGRTEQILSGKTVLAPEIGLIECEDVTIFQEGLETYIINRRNGNMIKISPLVAPDESYIEIVDAPKVSTWKYMKRFIKQFVPTLTSKKPSLMLCLAPPAFNNYGHVLIDQLPILHFSQEIESFGYTDIVFYRIRSGLLRERIRQLLKMLTISARSFSVRFQDRNYKHFRKVAIPWRTSVHPGVKHPLIRRFYSPLPIPEQRPLKIFVSRRDASDRRLVNEKEVYSRLKPYGFALVEGSKLTPAEAKKLFSRAKVVIGVSGASMANIVFCAPGTVVINLKSSENPAYWYWDLSNLFDLEYLHFDSSTYHTKENRSEDGVPRKTRDYYIDADMFISAVKEYL